MEMKELAEQLNTASTEIKSAQERIEEEVKQHGKATTETKTALEKHQADYAELKSRFEKLDEKFAEVEANQKSMRASHSQNETKSLGQAFTESEQFKAAVEQGANATPRVSMQRKDISNLSASAGALVRPDRDPTVYRNPSRPTRIRDLIPSIPTSSNSVEVMRQNVFTNNAAPQGTTSGIGGGEFASKAKSNITWELVSYPVRTVAHWVPASRQVLSDAPMLQSLIDTELNYGLDLQSDEQLLRGDGSGQNLTGLMVDTGVSDIGELPSGTATADVPAAMINHIRKAVTECQKNEYYNTNGIVLNPEDWATLETAKATDGHYLLMQFPANGANQQIWRMPVVVTNAMQVGEFLLGDWTMGAKIYEREDVSVRVSESHGTYFTENAVAILAEERLAFGVNLPKAFCKGAFSVAA